MNPKTFHSRRWILFVVFILVCASINGGSLRTLAAGEEWRPVEAADIALKTPVVEPNADAEAIFWDIRIDDGGAYDLVLNHYVRIKIFTERGRDEHSKVDIPYAGNVKIKDVAARTIKPDGTIIELAKEDIIEKVVVKVNGLKLRTKTFAFQGIEPGAIIEYRWKEVVTNSSPFNMPKFEFKKEKGGYQTTTVTNMRAFHEEPMMPPEDSVRAWAMVRYSGLSFLSYYILAGTIYYGLDSFLKVDDQIKKKAAEITLNAKTPEEKLEKIFEFCRTNIKNTNDINAGFSDDEIEKLKENKKPSDTLKRGVGPGIDINLLFAALAKAAGLEPRIALLPDRGKLLFNKNEVVPGALRPSNIAIKIGEQWQFFDPGLPYVPKGMLRGQQEGVDALLVAESPVWVKTPLSPAEKSKEKHVADLKLDENGTLEGDVTVEFTGHLAVERKVFNEDDSPEQREENLKESVKSRLSSAELTNIVIENATDSSKPFVYKYHVRVPEYAQRTGKRLFFQPGYFQKGISALFSAGTRSYPVYFHYPWSEEDKITIH